MIKTTVYDSICRTVSAQIRKRGIRPFARDTGVPVATVHKWVHKTTVGDWNALDLLAALVHTGGRLDLSPGPGKPRTARTKPSARRTARAKPKPQDPVPTS